MSGAGTVLLVLPSIGVAWATSATNAGPGTAAAVCVRVESDTRTERCAERIARELLACELGSGAGARVETDATDRTFQEAPECRGDEVAPACIVAVSARLGCPRILHVALSTGSDGLRLTSRLHDAGGAPVWQQESDVGSSLDTLRARLRSVAEAVEAREPAPRSTAPAPAAASPTPLPMRFRYLGSRFPAADVRPLERLEGGLMRFADVVGARPVLLAFFATYCKVCPQELGYLKEIHGHGATGGAAFLAVSVDGGRDVEGVRERVRTFAKDLELPFPILLDHTNAILGFYEVDRLPFLMFLDKEGIIRGVLSGYSRGEQDQIVKALSAMSGTGATGGPDGLGLIAGQEGTNTTAK